MSPSTRLRSGTVSRSKIVLWVAALAVGIVLGYGVATGLGQSGLAVIGAIAAGAISAVALIIMITVAAILAVASDASARPAARAIAVIAVMFATGVVIGRVFTPVVWPHFRDVVLLEAPGAMSVALDGLGGYSARTAAPATCRSHPDSESVAFVDAGDVGTSGGSVVAATISLASSEDRPEILVWIVPATDSTDTMPLWQGSGSDADRREGSSSGEAVFEGLAMTAFDAEGRQPQGWPSEVSGTLAWTCEPWVRR